MPIQRETAIDVMRGIALAGILLVHIFVFAMPMLNPEFSRVMFPGLLDRVADFLITWLIQGKFYPIFAFLFGWGAFVMASRTGNFNALYRRRLIGLLLIGILHAILLFEGDILVTYAVLGFFVRRAITKEWPVEKLVRRAKILLGVGIAAMLAVASLGAFGLAFGVVEPQTPATLAEVARQVREGGFVGLVPYRLVILAAVLLLLIVQAPIILAMFYLGLAAARTFAAEGIAAARSLAKRLLPWTLLPGLVGAGIAAVFHSFPLSVKPWVPELAEMIGLVVFGPLLAIGWLSLSVLLLSGRIPPVLVATLGAAGRMSLSVYVGQSVVMGFVYHSYGLGLFGTVGPAKAALIAIAAYAGLVVFAMVWLKMFRIGPLEWLLRPKAQPSAPGEARPVVA